MNRRSPIPTIPTRRALLAGAPAAAAAALAAGTAVNGLAVAVAASSAPDPIFAVIAKHRATIEAEHQAVIIVGEMIDSGPNKDPRSDAAKSALAAARDRDQDARWEVLTVQPTTLAGVAALLDHVGQGQFLGFEGADDETILSIDILNDQECPLKRAAQGFPIHLAETIRGQIGGQS
jgi:hypothetical protein